MNRPWAGAYQRVTTQESLVPSSAQEPWNRKSGTEPVTEVATPAGS